MDYIEKNKTEITEKKNIEQHKKEFDRLYQNYIDNKYKKMLEGNSWQVVYDGELEGDARYMGLIDADCIR